MVRLLAAVLAGVISFSARSTTAQRTGVKPAGKSPQRSDIYAMPTVLPITVPEPKYPEEAWKKGITGSGVCSMVINPSTGAVVRASMAVSMGNPLLDQAALSAFRKFRFKPGGPVTVRMPITFTRTGGYYGGPPLEPRRR